MFPDSIFRKIFIHTDNKQHPQNSDILDQLCVNSMMVIKTYLPTDENFIELHQEFRQNQPNLKSEDLIKVLVCIQVTKTSMC